MTTTEIISRYYATFSSGDREAFFELLAEDVIHDINQTGREIGIPAFRAFLERMDRSYAEVVDDLVIMIDPKNPSRAAAEFVIYGIYVAPDEDLPAATGQYYALPVGAFFEIRDSKIARITNYYNLQEWLRQIAAGYDSWQEIAHE